MSWHRPTLITCDADDCYCCWTGVPWEMGYEPRADGTYGLASVSKTRSIAQKYGWTSRMVETEGVKHLMDFCPDHSTES